MSWFEENRQTPVEEGGFPRGSLGRPPGDCGDVVPGKLYSQCRNPLGANEGALNLVFGAGPDATNEKVNRES